jgi:hypothetical protein
VATRKLERVADLGDLHLGRGVDRRFAGLTPGDVPLVSTTTTAGYIYSADLPH